VTRTSSTAQIALVILLALIFHEPLYGTSPMATIRQPPLSYKQPTSATMMMGKLSHWPKVTVLLCLGFLLFLAGCRVYVANADCETMAGWGIEVGHPDRGQLSAGCALEQQQGKADVSKITITPQQLEEKRMKKERGLQHHRGGGEEGIGGTNVPRILHQSYMTTEIAQPVYEIVNSWHTGLSKYNWTFVWWTDDDLSWLVHSHYPQYVKMFDGFAQQIIRVDFSRYLLLHRYGGLYSDIDNGYKFDGNAEDHVSIEDWFQRHGAKEPPHAYIFHDCIDNAMMASPPNSPFWDLVFAETQKSANNLVLRQRVNQVAGIDMLGRVCKSAQDSATVRLATPPSPFSKHYGTNSWRWKSKRKDFVKILDAIIGVNVVLSVLLLVVKLGRQRKSLDGWVSSRSVKKSP